MIKPITAPIVNFKQNQKNANASSKNSPFLSYCDSFAKHTKQTLPTITLVTALWTMYDKSAKNIPLKTALKNNMLTLFAPVLLLSSTILATVDQKVKNK
jgi:hypothetical protein